MHGSPCKRSTLPTQNRRSPSLKADIKLEPETRPIPTPKPHPTSVTVSRLVNGAPHRKVPKLENVTQNGSLAKPTTPSRPATVSLLTNNVVSPLIQSPAGYIKEDNPSHTVIEVKQSQLPIEVQQSQLPIDVKQSQLPLDIKKNQLPIEVKQSQLPIYVKCQLPNGKIMLVKKSVVDKIRSPQNCLSLEGKPAVIRLSNHSLGVTPPRGIQSSTHPRSLLNPRPLVTERMSDSGTSLINSMQITPPCVFSKAKKRLEVVEQEMKLPALGSVGCMSHLVERLLKLNPLLSAGDQPGTPLIPAWEQYKTWPLCKSP